MNKRIKKLISGALSLIVAGSCVSAAYAASDKYGDLDGNGLINSSDALIVLTSTVGAKKLTDAEFRLGDVDGNKVINSSDALDILLYSVGSLSRFKVETPAAPTKGDDILALYSNALKKARSEKPSYRINMVTETKDVDVAIKGLIPVPKDELDKQIREMKEQLEGTNEYKTICKQGSGNSLNNLPAQCTLTDSSKLKSITVKVLDNGNFKIDIKFNDESKPKAGSPLCKGLGVADYDTMLAKLREESSVDGMQINIELKELTYRNCSISCEINPVTGEFVNLNWTTSMRVSSSAPMVVLTATTSMTEVVTASYTDFGF